MAQVGTVGFEISFNSTLSSIISRTLIWNTLIYICHSLRSPISKNRNRILYDEVGPGLTYFTRKWFRPCKMAPTDLPRQNCISSAISIESLPACHWLDQNHLIFPFRRRYYITWHLRQKTASLSFLSTVILRMTQHSSHHLQSAYLEFWSPYTLSPVWPASASQNYLVLCQK